MDKKLEWLLKISSGAFDIHAFLIDFIKGEEMSWEDFWYLHRLACTLLDDVRDLRDIRAAEMEKADAATPANS